jgi:hypothetical protein
MELISLKLKFYCFARFRAKIQKILTSNLLVFVVGTNSCISNIIHNKHIQAHNQTNIRISHKTMLHYIRW